MSIATSAIKPKPPAYGATASPSSPASKSMSVAELNGFLAELDQILKPSQVPAAIKLVGMSTKQQTATAPQPIKASVATSHAPQAIPAPRPVAVKPVSPAKPLEGEAAIAHYDQMLKSSHMQVKRPAAPTASTPLVSKAPPTQTMGAQAQRSSAGEVCEGCCNCLCCCVDTTDRAIGVAGSVQAARHGSAMGYAGLVTGDRTINTINAINEGTYKQAADCLCKCCCEVIPGCCNLIGELLTCKC